MEAFYANFYKEIEVDIENEQTKTEDCNQLNKPTTSTSKLNSKQINYESTQTLSASSDSSRNSQSNLTKLVIVNPPTTHRNRSSNMDIDSKDNNEGLAITLKEIVKKQQMKIGHQTATISSKNDDQVETLERNSNQSSSKVPVDSQNYSTLSPNQYARNETNFKITVVSQNQNLSPQFLSFNNTTSNTKQSIPDPLKTICSTQYVRNVSNFQTSVTNHLNQNPTNYPGSSCKRLYSSGQCTITNANQALSPSTLSNSSQDFEMKECDETGKLSSVNLAQHHPSNSNQIIQNPQLPSSTITKAMNPDLHLENFRHKRQYPLSSIDISQSGAHDQIDNSSIKRQKFPSPEALDQRNNKQSPNKLSNNHSPTYSLRVKDVMDQIVDKEYHISCSPDSSKSPSNDGALASNPSNQLKNITFPLVSQIRKDKIDEKIEKLRENQYKKTGVLVPVSGTNLLAKLPLFYHQRGPFLEDEFQRNALPGMERVLEISDLTGLHPEFVMDWFIHRYESGRPVNHPLTPMNGTIYERSRLEGCHSIDLSRPREQITSHPNQQMLQLPVQLAAAQPYRYYPPQTSNRMAYSPPYTPQNEGNRYIVYRTLTSPSIFPRVMNPPDMIYVGPQPHRPHQPINILPRYPQNNFSQVVNNRDNVTPYYNNSNIENESSTINVRQSTSQNSGPKKKGGRRKQNNLSIPKRALASIPNNNPPPVS